MARFKVRRCGINELENIAMAVSSQQLAIKDKEALAVCYTNKIDTWQAAIFKVTKCN